MSNVQEVDDENCSNAMPSEVAVRCCNLNSYPACFFHEDFCVTRSPRLVSITFMKYFNHSNNKNIRIRTVQETVMVVGFVI